VVARRVFLKLPQGYGKTPGANTVELNDGPRDFGVRCPAGWCLPRSRLASNPVAEIISVDTISPTAAPSNAGTSRPQNPPFIRSGHLTAPGFSDHRIYWEEYGTLAGEPVMVMHGGPGAGSHSSSARLFDPQRYRVIRYCQLKRSWYAVVSVARQHGSGNSFACLSCCPAQPSGAGERRLGPLS